MPRKLQDFEKLENMVRIRVPRDGSCFYSSLSLSIFGSMNGTEALRQVIARFVWRNWDYFSGFQTGFTKDQMYEYHTMPGTFATAVQVQAAAMALQVQIVVKFPQRLEKFEGDMGCKNGIVYMFFEPPFDAGHFDCLLPKYRVDQINSKLQCVSLTRTAPQTPSSSSEWQTVGRRGRVTRSPDLPPETAQLPRSPEPLTQGAVAPSRPTPRTACEEPTPTGTGSKSPNFSGNHLNFCSCDYNPDELANLAEDDWKQCITMSEPEDCFPIKVKIEGRLMLGLVDPQARRSILSSNACTGMQRIKITTAFVKLENDEVIAVDGIFNPTVSLSERVHNTLPMLVARIAPDLVLGQDFLEKFSAVYNRNSDTMTFSIQGEKVSKHRAKVKVEKDPYEILELDDNFGELFYVSVLLDGLRLTAALDTGATRTVLKANFCTNRSALRKTNVKLTVANKTELPVHGVYTPTFTFADHFKLKHSVIVAEDLPVDILIGNDLLKKVLGTISWETETAKLKMGNLTVELDRVQMDSTPQNATPKTFLLEDSRLGDIDVDSEYFSPLCLLAEMDCVLEPQNFTMVPVFPSVNKHILPLIVSPCLLDGTDAVASVECVLSDALEVPVFNGTNDVFHVGKGTKIGYVEMEDQNIAAKSLIPTNFLEIYDAIDRGQISIDELNIEDAQCNLITETSKPKLPSVADCDITEKQKLKVQDKILDCEQVFSYSLKPGAFIPNMIAHLERTNDSTIFKKNWVWNQMQRRLAEQEVENLLASGVIEEGLAKVTLPVFIIPKRGSTLEKPVGRLLWDARALNATLKRWKFKSTTIQDALSYCADKNLLCVCDIVSYFFTIKMTEESKQYLGFQVGNKFYRWSRLPQGLSVSPQIAQQAMMFVLGNLPVTAYMDDVVVGGRDFEETFSIFSDMLDRMKENNLCLRPDKAVLFKKVVPFLGLIVEAGVAARPDPSRFRPLLQLKYPKTPKQLKSAICFLSFFRRYIPKFAVKTKHYNDMANEKLPFKWEEKDALFIESMYSHLLNTATLALFDPSLPTKVHIDGSKQNVAGFLSQKRNGRYLPVGYFSQHLTVSQTAWSAFHIEALGLYSVIKYFEKELLNLDVVKVVTDCSSLRYLMNTENPKAPLDRFIAYLSQYTLEFEVIRTDQNKVPDSLSRLEIAECPQEVALPNSLTTPLKPVNIVMQVQTRAQRKLCDAQTPIVGDRLFESPRASIGTIPLQPRPLLTPPLRLPRNECKISEVRNAVAADDTRQVNGPQGVATPYDADVATTRSRSARDVTTSARGIDSWEHPQRASEPPGAATSATQSWDERRQIIHSTDAICSFTGKYYFLSPLSPSDIEIEGKKFKSVQHALECSRLSNKLIHDLVAESRDPILAKGTVDFNDLAAECELNYDYLLKCTAEKFAENSVLAEMLVETYPKQLIFGTVDHDNVGRVCFCNKCKDKPFQNLIGRALMEQREFLISKYLEKGNKIADSSLPQLARLKRLQREDPLLLKIIQCFTSDGKPKANIDKIGKIPKYKMIQGLLVTNTAPPRTVIPAQAVPNILHALHDLTLHSGEAVMSMAVSKYYYWQSMNEDIKSWVKSCKTCSEFKPHNVRYGLLQPSPMPADVFEELAADFTHVITTNANKSKHCLVICDVYSNFCYLRPCRTASTGELIKGLVDFFYSYGVCRKLFVDASSISKSKEFHEFLNRLNIQLVVAPSHAHFSAGRVESQVKRVVSALRFLINDKLSNKKRWDQLLPLVQFYINNSPQVATQKSANELVYGRQLNTPLTLKTLLPAHKNLLDRFHFLEKIRLEAADARKKATLNYKSKYDYNRKNVSFSVGSPVFVWFERKASLQNPLKLQKRYRLGTVARKISDVLYLIRFRKANGSKWTRLTHVAHLKPFLQRPKRLRLKNSSCIFLLKDKGEIYPLLPSLSQGGACVESLLPSQSIGVCSLILGEIYDTFGQSFGCESCYTTQMWMNYA